MVFGIFLSQKFTYYVRNSFSQQISIIIPFFRTNLTCLKKRLSFHIVFQRIKLENKFDSWAAIEESHCPPEL